MLIRSIEPSTSAPGYEASKYPHLFTEMKIIPESDIY